MTKIYVNNSKRAAIIGIILALLAIYVFINSSEHGVLQLVFTGILLYVAVVQFLEAKVKKVEICDNILTYTFLGTFFKKNTIKVDLNFVDRSIIFHNHSWILFVNFLSNFYWPSYIILLKKSLGLKEGVQIYLDYPVLKAIKKDLEENFSGIAWQETNNLDVVKATLRNI